MVLQQLFNRLQTYPNYKDYEDALLQRYSEKISGIQESLNVLQIYLNVDELAIDDVEINKTDNNKIGTADSIATETDAFLGDKDYE